MLVAELLLDKKVKMDKMELCAGKTVRKGPRRHLINLHGRSSFHRPRGLDERNCCMRIGEWDISTGPRATSGFYLVNAL